MINLHRKRMEGAATLIITAILLVAITFIVLFAANYIFFQQRITSNTNRNNQAFEAAEAGLEFSIQYLQANRTAIIATATNGYINYSDSSTTNVTFTNGSKFSVVFTNPIQNNYDTIQITSTGVSDDGTSTRIIQQQVKYSSYLNTPPILPMTVRGTVNLSGSFTITNTETNQTIRSGSAVTFSGSAHTVTQTGGSDRNSVGLDVQPALSAISNLTTTQMFSSYFTNSLTSGSTTYSYEESSNRNYSTTLNGMTGSSIWINQKNGTTATLNGTITIGSPSAPVLLVVQGNLEILGNVTIYGMVYVINSQEFSLNEEVEAQGNSQIIGGLVVTGGLAASGNSQVTFNSSVLNNLQQSVLGYYTKIPGTWKDF